MGTTRTVTSLLDGQPVESTSAGTLTIADPAHLEEIVSFVEQEGEAKVVSRGRPATL